MQHIFFLFCICMKYSVCSPLAYSMIFPRPFRFLSFTDKIFDSWYFWTLRFYAVPFLQTFANSSRLSLSLAHFQSVRLHASFLVEIFCLSILFSVTKVLLDFLFVFNHFFAFTWTCIPLFTDPLKEKLNSGFYSLYICILLKCILMY